jgi:MFS family permease
MALKIQTTLWLLGICHFFGYTVFFTHMSGTTAAAKEIIDIGGLSKGLSTVALSVFMASIATTLLPSAALMNRFGYKKVFMLGTVLGICGGIVAFCAAFCTGQLSLTLLVLGEIPLGLGYGIVQYYKHVASIYGSVNKLSSRAWNIAIVITSGAISGAAGPTIVAVTQNMIPGRKYAGMYIVMSAVNLLHLISLKFVELNLDQKTLTSTFSNKQARPIKKIFLQPDYIYSSITESIVNALMFSVIGITTLILKDKINFNYIAIIYAFHMGFMFLPSFGTSKLLIKFTPDKVATAGVLMGAIGCAIFLTGDINHDVWYQYGIYFLAMVFVGLGWNLTLIGCISLLSTTYHIEEKFKAQGLNDTMIYVLGAVFVGVSGQGLALVGKTTVMLVAMTIYLVAFFANIVYLTYKYKFRKVDLKDVLSQESVTETLKDAESKSSTATLQKLDI